MPSSPEPQVEPDLLAYEDEGLFARDADGQLIRLVEATAAEYDAIVELTIDGRPVKIARAVPMTDSQGIVLRDNEGRTFPRRTTIYDAAREAFVKHPGDVNPIPILCHQEHMKPAGVCRICCVQIVRDGKQDKALVPACFHRAEPGMEVHTIRSPDEKASRRVRQSVGMLLELLAADHLKPASAGTASDFNELSLLTGLFLDHEPRFAPRATVRGRDDSSSVIAVNHEACVLCDRCVRACDDVKKNLVIGRTGKGYTAHIGFDLNHPMGQSSCVSCGECMISCPTEALTFRGEIAHKVVEDGEVVSAEELKRDVPLFAQLPFKFLEWNTGAVRRRRLKAGDLLCREGDYGSTAFIITRGRFEVSIRTPQARLENRRASGLWGALGGIVSRLVSTPAESGLIPADGGAPLPAGKPIAQKTPEDLILGEMTCLSHYPRAATVQAVEDSEVLEIQRNVLYMLQRNPTSRELLNRVYRARALDTQVRQLSIFSDLNDSEKQDCIDFLHDRIELVQVPPGQVIFRQGERADHFYIVRLGFVKVVQKYEGGERVRNYLGPGRHFGEIGILSQLADGGLSTSGVGLRTATCSALDDVELVRVKGEHFRELIERYPQLRERFLKYANRLLQEDAAQVAQFDRPLDAFLEQGLFEAQRLLVLDLESCTRCDECTRACADTHGGVTRLIRDGLRFDKFLVASSCRSCLDPYCLVGCPVDAIHRQGSLEIRIENHCIGCGLCANNCPYGNINMHGFPKKVEDPSDPGKLMKIIQQKATTCDLCASIDGQPSCVYACPHNAAFRMSGEALMTLVNAREK